MIAALVHWDDEVRDIRRVYKDDPEAAHGMEDALLDTFVRGEALAGNPIAASLLPLLDASRMRWYA